MDGIRFPSACDRTMKVGRCFEWSRLESELMTSAYERVLPVGRRAGAESALPSREPGCGTFGKLERDRPSYATGV